MEGGGRFYEQDSVQRCEPQDYLLHSFTGKRGFNNTFLQQDQIKFSENFFFFIYIISLNLLISWSEHKLR